MKKTSYLENSLKWPIDTPQIAHKDWILFTASLACCSPACQHGYVLDTTPSEIRQFIIDLCTTLSPGLRAANRDAGAIDTKTDFHDVVTVHDRATEVAIREAIFERFPESVVLGEETGWSNRTGDTGEPSPNDLIWIVDPIDGTSNFAGGWDYWCISISAARGGEFVASGVCQPIVNRIWSADDTGAYLDEPGYETRRLSVQRDAVPSDGLCATEYPKINSADDSALVRWREAGRSFRSMRRPGSTALDLCYVADGRAVASFSTGVHSWDVAAGIHIIQQAGGIYEGYNGTELSTPIWDGSSFVAGASKACVAAGRKALGL